MVTQFTEILKPFVSKISAAISTVNAAYMPVAKPFAITSYVTSIGLTSYGIMKLWPQNNDVEETRFFAKFSLSMIYGLHIGCMSYCLANIIGDLGCTPEMASLYIGGTALLKSLGEYACEAINNQHLYDKQIEVQQQLKKKALEFNRYLILVEDLNKTESEISLLVDEHLSLSNSLKQLNPRSLSEERLKEIFTTLKLRAHRNQLKQSTLLAFDQHPEIIHKNPEFQEKITTLFHEKNELLSKISTLKAKRIQNPKAISALMEEIRLLDLQNEELGLKDQCWKKYARIKSSIKNFETLIKEIDNYTAEELALNQYVLDCLNQKLIRARSQSSSSNSILDLTFDSLLTKGKSESKKWLKQFIADEIDNLDSSINTLKQQHDQKKEKFYILSNYEPNDVDKDFSSLCEKIKEVIELQNQAAIAALTERNKEKSLNFSAISSFLALVICTMPNMSYLQRINQLKNGIGGIALVINNIDMLRKYLLNKRLTARENKDLLRVLRDVSFYQIAQVKNAQVHQSLIDKIKEVKQGIVDVKKTEHLAVNDLANQANQSNNIVYNFNKEAKIKHNLSYSSSKQRPKFITMGK